MNKTSGATPRPGSSTSAKRPAAAKPAPKVGSGRTRPREDDDEEDGPKDDPMLKKVMFFGTIGLVLVFLVLLLVKGGDIINPPKPPPKPKDINHNKMFEEIDDMISKARTDCAKARTIKDDAQRNTAYRAVMDLLGKAGQKLEALSENPAYRGKEEFDAHFTDRQQKIGTELKVARDGIKILR